MNSKEAFHKTGRLAEKIKENGRQLQRLKSELEEVMDKCPHEIVFKYIDNHPRKMF